MRKRQTLILSLLLVVFLLGGCAEKEVADIAEKETTKEAVEEAVENTAQDTDQEEALEEKQEAELPDGTYTAEFHTDNSMFHVSEACDGKGTLTVQDGKMTIHVSLGSKKIVNLYPGTAQEAKENEGNLLQPTVDTVTYSDGMTEEVYGFDIPVPAIDEEFDLALIGKKNKWYDHKVKVTNPQKESDEVAEKTKDAKDTSKKASEK